MVDVSVVIPTYNRCDDLLQAIDSVRQSTYRDWEIIVIDDGSDDGTARAMDELEDYRIRVIWHEHCGRPGILRNRAVEQASGDLIAFLDSDDLWLREKLAFQVAALEANRDCGWCATNVTRDIDGNSGASWVVAPPQGQIDTAVKLMSHKFSIATPSVVVRRRLIEQVGGFDEQLEYCEDYDLWIRLALCSPLCFLSQFLTETRYRPDHFRSPQLEVQLTWAGIMRKHMQHENTEIRRCARQRLSFHLASLGRLHANDGRLSKSVKHLLAALREDPFSITTWREIPLVPLRGMRNIARKLSD